MANINPLTYYNYNYTHCGLVITKNDTMMKFSHDEPIWLSKGGNIADAAVGLLETALLWKKDMQTAMNIDAACVASGKVRINRLTINIDDTTISYNTYNTNVSHMAEYTMFVALKEHFDKAKELKVFL